MELSVTYIYHDCFIIKSEECLLIFDFWKNPGDQNEEFPAFLNDIPSDFPVYVFVSHFHKDHFNKIIFLWEKHLNNIIYIISKDTSSHAGYLLKATGNYKGHKPDTSRVKILKNYESYSDVNVSVKAYGSTDIGNSYSVVLNSSDIRIFHAGDLNCWTWRDESSEEEIAEAEKAFRKELYKISEENEAYDIVMFPVDSRIGTGYSQGAREFVNSIKVNHFFPMHFELADTSDELKKRKKDAMNFELYSNGYGEYIALTGSGDRFVKFMKREECDSQNNSMKEGNNNPDICEISSQSQDCTSEASGKKITEFSQSFFLSAGEVNAERELSLPLLTAKLIDIATAHANHLGIGNPDMPDDHSGWVLSRLTIDMQRYPAVDTDYKITTWVESWNRHFSERAFCIEDLEGNVYGYARSIWMVLDTVTHANAGLDRLPLKEEYISGKECPIERQGKHLNLVPPQELASASGKFLKADQEIGIHRFLYSDLDAYRHVNTVRYVSLLINQFPLDVHDKYRVGRLEISFLQEGQYDRPIEILRAEIDAMKPESNGYAFQLRRKEDKEKVLFARMRLDLRDNLQNPVTTF